METPERLLTDYLLNLGYDDVATKLYVTLSQHGPATLSVLSRLSGIERTRIYRLLQPLQNRGLIDVTLQQKRRVVHATDPRNLLIDAHRRATQARQLVDGFEEVEAALSQMTPRPPSRVQYYEGTSGIRQMMLRELNARGAYLAVSHAAFESVVGVTFFNEWAREMLRRRIESRHLRSDGFTTTAVRSDSAPIIAWNRKATVTDRYIRPGDLNITHSTSIYNGVVNHYHWGNGEIFGFEIVNADTAAMQTAHFELAWQKSRPRRRR